MSKIIAITVIEEDQRGEVKGLSFRTTEIDSVDLACLASLVRSALGVMGLANDYRVDIYKRPKSYDSLGPIIKEGQDDPTSP